MHDFPARAPAAAPPTDLSPGITTPGSVPPTPPWPLWQRLGFRYLLLHWVLYTFPSPLSGLLATVGGLCRWGAKAFDQPWLLDRPFRWSGKWATELGKLETRFWEPLTTSMQEQGLAPYEVIHQGTGSGDTGHDFARLLAIVVVALVATTIWSLLQRGPGGHPRLGRWLHLLVRFDLAFTMLSYGLSKLYGGQFGELSLDRLTTEVGDLRPMAMVGTFMQASKPYELFGGVGEVLAGLLLFHRRTALLGACTTIAVMANVCALNWLYGVPVKLWSAHLLLVAVFLLAPFAPRLWAVFVSNRQAPPVDLTVVRATWARWALTLGGAAWVLASLWLSHVHRSEPRPGMKAQAKSALYGLWLVDKMLLDGVEVPVTDATRWRYFAVDRGTVAWVRETGGRRRTFEFRLDEAAQTAQVKERGPSGGQAEPWTCATGVRVVPVDVPLLMTNADRSRKVDGERRSLVVKGKWGDQQLELHTVEKVFRLQTGFRLRQELPDFW